MRKKLIWATILLVSGGFFSGCTVQQRKEILEEAKLYAFEQGKILLEQAKEQGKVIAIQAVEKIQKKADEEEAKQFAALDQQLTAFKVVDQETQIEISKTWRDFDADKSGHLEPIELGKVTAYITTQTAKKIATGEIDKNTAGQTGKSTGATISVLLALYLARRGAGALTSKLKPATTPATPRAGGAPPL